MQKTKNFCIIGKVENEQVFNTVLDLVKNLPNVDVRFHRVSEHYLYVVDDYKRVAKTGALRKRRQAAE